MVSSKPTAIDLFAGAGGLSLGFENAGFTVVMAVESNPVYCQTYKRNFPNSVIINEDIRNLSPERLSAQTGLKKGEIAVVIGGPPCQTFSSIGTPKIRSLTNGMDHTDIRNYLFEKFVEFVQYFRPRAFVMENVPAMRTKYNGKLYDNLITSLRKLPYEVAHDVLDASEYGVPQKRKRLFVIGVAKGQTFEFPKKTHFGHPNTVGDAIMDLPRVSDGAREHYLPYPNKQPLTSYQKAMRSSSGKVGNNICRMSNERAKKVFQHMKQGDRYLDLPKGVRNILPFREDIFHDRLKRLVLNEPAWTILAHIGMDGYMYIHPTENRTLSVREAARLQSFHDDFEFVGNMREQYIQIGNAVPPMLAEKIAKSLKRNLR